MLGSCHHSIHTVITAALRCIPGDQVRVVQAHEGISLARLHVVAGVRNLVRISDQLVGARTTVMVVDTITSLNTVQGMSVLDSDPRDTGWTPRPIRIAPLRAALLGSAPPHAPIVIIDTDVVARMIADARSSGVFDKVLAYAQRLPGAAERDGVHRTVAAYLGGSIALSTMRSRTAPAKQALAELHEAMCDALGSDRGAALGRAIRMVADGMDARVASVETGADAFEIRYCTAVLAKAKA